MDSLQVVHDTVKVIEDTGVKDWMVFIADLVKGGSWPLLVLVGVAYFRKPIKDLMDRIKSIDGTKVDFNAKQVTAIAKKQIEDIDAKSKPIEKEVQIVKEKLVHSDVGVKDREKLVQELEDAQYELSSLKAEKEHLNNLLRRVRREDPLAVRQNEIIWERNQVFPKIYRLIEKKYDKPFDEISDQEKYTGWKEFISKNIKKLNSTSFSILDIEFLINDRDIGNDYMLTSIGIERLNIAYSKYDDY